MAENMNVAYLFPGDESVQVGMGLDLYDRYKSARDVFDEIDKTLKFPLSRLCFEGPEEELTDTINVQAAVLTISIACLRAAEEICGGRLPAPAMIAGHGSGEYTALVAAGVLTLSDAVRLIRERGRLMNEESRRKSGRMAAIEGLDQEKIDWICRTIGVEISNINSPDNIVISNDMMSVGLAERVAWIKYDNHLVPVRAAGAFYSSLMKPALEGIIKAVSQYKFEPPKYPVIANITAQPMTSVEEIKEELTGQITNCIRWQQSIEIMLDRGIDTFLEVGPGDSLAKYVKRINLCARTFNVNNLETIEEINQWLMGAA